MDGDHAAGCWCDSGGGGPCPHHHTQQKQTLQLPAPLNYVLDKAVKTIASLSILTLEDTSFSSFM